MKALRIATGLAMMLCAGSANASVVYDTITGQTKANSNLLVTTAGFHAPEGSSFTAAFAETINSVTVQLYGSCGGTTTALCTDAGAVLVYLVPGTGSPSLPSAIGLSLSNSIFLGSIADNTLLGNSLATAANNVTLSTTTSIGAGTWWVMLTSASDPNNFQGSVNSTLSTAKWGEILTTATGTTGVPTGGWYTAGTNFATSAIIGGINNHSSVGTPSPNDEIFMMTIDATVSTPEPTSLAILGVGLAGLGFKRRFSNKKPIA